MKNETKLDPQPDRRRVHDERQRTRSFMMNDRERARQARREELRQRLPAIIIGWGGALGIFLATLYLPHRYLALILALACFAISVKILSRGRRREDESFMLSVGFGILVIGLGLLILAMTLTSE